MNDCRAPQTLGLASFLGGNLENVYIFMLLALLLL